MHTYYVAEGHFLFPGYSIARRKSLFPTRGRKKRIDKLSCQFLHWSIYILQRCEFMWRCVIPGTPQRWFVMKNNGKTSVAISRCQFSSRIFFFFIWNIHTNRYYSRSLIVELVICKSGPVGCPQPFVYGSKLRIIQFWTTNDILRHCELEVFRDNDWHFSTVL